MLRAIIFDMDGVIYHDHVPVAGIQNAINSLRLRGIKLFFLTNNASRSRASVARRLKKMRIAAHIDEIGTSAYSAAKYVAKIHPRARVAVLGMRGLKTELRAQKLRIVGAGGKPHFFVNGIDFSLTYKKLSDAVQVLKNPSVRWACCNPDPTFPAGNGVEKPGSGALTAALACASGRKPEAILGKPNTQILAPILSECKKAKIKNSEIALVGDRLEIDVLLANRVRIVPILVLTGVATANDAKKAKGKFKPKFVLKSAAELPNFLTGGKFPESRLGKV